MFNPDVPIRRSTDDLLGRLPFATSLAEAILEYREAQSIVIGLYGKWGSGKSSVINMCIEHIQRKSTERPDQSKPIIVKFNPWNFSDQNQLLSQFFIQFSAAIKRTDMGEMAVKIANKLEAYSAFFLPLELVPEPSTSLGAGLASKAIKRTSIAVRSWGELRKKDLEATRDEIDNLLRERQQRVLIFIDDIDRLTGTEMRQIFQLVKLIGDFFNTTYILSLDDAVVIEALEPVQHGVGSEYLEKIIQIPFHLPAIDSEAVHKFLIRSINLILDDVPSHLHDAVYWGNIFQGGLMNLFANLRDVIRYLNVLQFNFAPIKNEVNAIDFMALTALQVFEPDVYREIATHKNVFAGLYDGIYGEQTQLLLRNECDSIMLKATRLNADTLIRVLKRIFPRLEKIYDNRGYDSGALAVWRRHGRACSPDKFDIYFRLCIASTDISDVEMTRILSTALSQEEFALTIQQLFYQQRINRFLERIYDYIQHGIPDENIQNIFNVFLDLGDMFPDEEGFRGFGVSQNITQILIYLLNRIESQELRYQVIHEAFSQSENSLHVVLTYLEWLGLNHGKGNEDGRELEPEDLRIVSPGRLEALEKLGLEKIRRWATSGKLMSHKDLKFILYKWKDLSGSFEEPRAFVSSVTTDVEGAINIICRFAGKFYFHGLDDYVADERISIDLKPYQSFSDPKHLADSVRPVLESGAPNVALDRLQILKMFVEKYDGALASQVDAEFLSPDT